MTSEHIAELRHVFGAGCAQLTVGQCVAVLHLIDERAALLAALRAAAMALGDAHGEMSKRWASETPPDREAVEDASEAEDVARAAIAKAMAP